LLPAFVEDALDPGDPVFFVSRGGDGGTRRKTRVWGEWNLVAVACNLRRLFALAPA